MYGKVLFLRASYFGNSHNGKSSTGVWCTDAAYSETRNSFNITSQNITPIELANDHGILSEILICQIIQDIIVIPQIYNVQLKAICDFHSGFVCKSIFDGDDIK